MTIYVDEAIDYGVRYGRAGPVWCHMTTDGNKEELHAFAKRLGLKRSYFQDDALLWHYDLTARDPERPDDPPRMREKAVRMGAVEVEAFEWIPRLFAIRRVEQAGLWEQGVCP